MSWAQLFSTEPIDWFQHSGGTSVVTASYEEWLQQHFSHVATAPLSERHHRLWRWFDSLSPGQKPRARIEPWPRGGAKSATGELGIAYIGCKLSRRFVLYVSETQDQADRHVQSVASLFEKVGVERSLTKYGHSKGWRRNQLRTAHGFNLEALGLDTAARGIKLDEFRPDLIIFDDIDNQNDSPKVTEKKTRTIQSSIIPAGSTDCAVLFLQNLIHELSIVSTLVEGTADFLHNREVATVEKAVNGLEVERELQDDGSKLYRIVAGVPTWEGQNISICESQINDWGYATFLRESQHEVQGANGYFFDHSQVDVIKRPEFDELRKVGKWRFCRAWDLAATQDGGDYTVGVLMAIGPNKVVYVVDVKRDRLSSEKVRALILDTAEDDQSEYGRVEIHLPQDPGQAGKDQADQYKKILSGYVLKIEPVTGKKAVRARGWADCMNKGNARAIEAEWNRAYLEEHRKFREDEEHEFDDQIDPSADAYNELAGGRQIKFFYQ